jgi:hypothetical protein
MPVTKELGKIAERFGKGWRESRESEYDVRQTDQESFLTAQLGT